ncbi:MAG: hypothetical protein IJR34_01765, partial [Bacteroidales bacterium]|nr:hypothetical protein [Bacteroidales bacterium]
TPPPPHPGRLNRGGPVRFLLAGTPLRLTLKSAIMAASLPPRLFFLGMNAHFRRLSFFMKHYAKPFKTHEEQVQLLMQRGLVVSDVNEAVSVLRTVNYYRFTGYAIRF